MSIDISNLTKESLAALDTTQLINMVLVMGGEIKTLKNSTTIDLTECEKRLEALEREVNKDKQYLRRDTIEVVGIPSDVTDEEIEDEVIKVLKAAKVKLGNKFPNAFDINAAHRIGKKGKVIVKFVNRKFAVSAMTNRSNLKGINEYSQVFLNQILCPEFQFLNYAVRKGKANGELFFYKMRNGITFIKQSENGPFHEITHVSDLSRYNITIPNRSS